MSSWERARFIPWSRIPKDGTDFESQKENILRDLQRETIEEELRQQQQQQDPNNNSKAASAAAGSSSFTTTNDAQISSGGGGSSKDLISRPKIPYSNMDLLRQAAFGGCIGSITGAVFGFLDGMRSAGESPVLQKASNMAKTRYLIQGTTRSATLFGVFFGGFHVVKYGFRIMLDSPGDFVEIGMAGCVSMGALAYKPAYRASMPYAAMLVGMEAFQQGSKRYFGH